MAGGPPSLGLVEISRACLTAGSRGRIATQVLRRPDNLNAVAALPNGEEALRLTAAGVAEFTTATPTYGHKILALLLLEGMADVLTTNWDDCIERGGGLARVSVVVTEYDLLNVTPKAVLKIHGCATQPMSLLITSEQLETPPAWVGDQTRARLGTSIVVFVGIGDIAGYVRKRLEEAIENVGSPSNVRVVSPGIGEYWTGSAWAELLPGLEVEHRIAETSDAFLDKLGAAYVLVTLADVGAGFLGEPSLSEPFEAALTALKQHDALTILAWVRHTAVVATAGKSVLTAPATATALMALGRLVGANFRIERDLVITTPSGPIEVLVAMGTQPVARLRREAQNRLERHLGNGRDGPSFVVAGGIGWPPDGQLSDEDIFGGGSVGDVLDGPLNVRAELIRAEAVLAG